MDSTVISLRLVTGEEVIAEVSIPGQLAIDDAIIGCIRLAKDSIIVNRPNVLHAMQGRDGQMGLALVPWFNSDPDAKNIRIKEVDIVGIIRTPEKIAKSYLQQVSGIALI